VSQAAARLHVVVQGDVQGVGFRDFVARQAREADLAGWVRNRADGSVECVAEGARSALERLLEDLRRGPRLAEVSSVDAHWEEPGDDLGAFQVLV
jgi:acylphosphatase